MHRCLIALAVATMGVLACVDKSPMDPEDAVTFELSNTTRLFVTISVEGQSFNVPPTDRVVVSRSAVPGQTFAATAGAVRISCVFQPRERSTPVRQIIWNGTILICAHW